MRPARIFGVYAVIFGALGVLFFAFVVQSWAMEAMKFHYSYQTRACGEAYETIYNIEVPVYGLMAVNSFIVLIAGIGILLREKWSAAALWICGLIFVAGLWALLTFKNVTYHSEQALAEITQNRTLGDMLTPYIVVLLISATIIVPAFIPAVRVALHKTTNFVSRKRR